MTRGDYVRTWFDTGAMGANILFGRVIADGERTFTVEWESGTRNRFARNYAGIETISVGSALHDIARAAMCGKCRLLGAQAPCDEHGDGIGR